MVGVRLFFGFLACYPILKVPFCLAQIMEQSGQFSLLVGIEMCREPFSAARHAKKMFDQRLIRVGEILARFHKDYEEKTCREEKESLEWVKCG